MDFLSNPLFIGGMCVALVALVGLMIFMRMKKKDDE